MKDVISSDMTTMCVIGGSVSCKQHI